MIAGLMQGQQKQKEQQKQNAIGAMLGQAPGQSAPQQQGGGMGAGIMDMAGKMMGGMEQKAHKEPDSDDMLQGLYGDKGNIDDEDLLNREV